MRLELDSKGTRASALWGKPSRGETRGSALWGKGGRGLVATFALAVALAAPAVATAGPGDEGRYGSQQRAFVPSVLEAAARANPAQLFSVIVQSRGSTGAVASEVGDAADETRTRRDALERRFATMGAVSARLTGTALLRLSNVKSVLAITPDAPVVLTGYSSTELWPRAANLARLWRSKADAPAIAIVDSGIDASRGDFDGRVVADVKITELANNSAGDGRGHGTFVAGIAAGGAAGKAGAAPNAEIVSIDVMDDTGMAMTSDVIAAADWILQNKERYDIRVANFSLHSSVPASIMWDPLDAAVERLWFAGVVVVAASGNYGSDAGPSGIPFAPANDPFVITVGAADIADSRWTRDDVAAPWSAYGYTLDGFAKPELVAPGRYMVGPVPPSSTLALERPENLRQAGYMELSGTSFAAPVVAGAAAQILAAHPTWTPDQVKGALMLTADHLPRALPLSVGVGELDAHAAARRVPNPPNPNEALNRFVESASGGGGLVFDAASWASTARADASWASASWASASWASASWASASWASASWASASWASASWASDEDEVD